MVWGAGPVQRLCRGEGSREGMSWGGRGAAGVEQVRR